MEVGTDFTQGGHVQRAIVRQRGYRDPQLQEIKLSGRPGGEGNGTGECSET